MKVGGQGFALSRGLIRWGAGVVARECEGGDKSGICLADIKADGRCLWRYAGDYWAVYLIKKRSHLSMHQKMYIPVVPVMTFFF